ncbi:hypothetical protein MMC25_005571 [Agyrium rufum]|nr:hypothetical protein [Agyrium rufum]
MRFSIILSVLGASFACARSPLHVGPSFGPNRASQQGKRAFEYGGMPSRGSQLEKRAHTFLNANTSKFAVDGTAIPDVDFDIGESYAGLLPISDNPKETSELYFWFFPSTNPKAEDEITIWLNGGPGCSSLEGLLQENGPFIWQYGTFKPVPNTYTWRNLTNMVWVEQPVGTGFTQGKPIATNETTVAEQFMGFFKNFVDTFSLQNKKVFITGESYAGQYVPYIADAMFNANNTEYFNVDSIMIYDPVLSSNAVQNQIPAAAFMNYWNNILAINATYQNSLNSLAQQCGYSDFLKKYLVYPPKGPMPPPPTANANYGGKCDVYNQIINAATLVNPCFDIYQIATTCPLLWDVLGFPGSFDYLPDGATIYFNRTDVQKAINAPMQEWEECSGGVLRRDTSPPVALSNILPNVIERSQRTVIGHGQLDAILLSNGTLLAIQNMTWGGKLGFQSPPTANFFVPYHEDYVAGSLAGAGVFGKTHTERKLTFVSVELSGHMIPQYAPSAAYRHLEFLLGRIPNLSDESDFTTQPGSFGN